MFKIINKYITETKKPAITAIPPSLGIGFLCTFLFSGMSNAPTFFANLIVYGVITKLVSTANTNAIITLLHIILFPSF